MREVVYHDNKNPDKKEKKTICVIEGLDSFYVGIAKCSKKDDFRKNIGRPMAQWRARSLYGARNSTIISLIENDYQFVVPKNSTHAAIYADKFDIPLWMLQEKKEEIEIPF